MNIPELPVEMEMNRGSSSEKWKKNRATSIDQWQTPFDSILIPILRNSTPKRVVGWKFFGNFAYYQQKTSILA